MREEVSAEISCLQQRGLRVFVVFSEVNVQSVGPRAHRGSVTPEEPELSRYHSLILRDRGNIEGDVHPLEIISYWAVAKGLYETGKNTKSRRNFGGRNRSTFSKTKNQYEPDEN